MALPLYVSEDMIIQMSGLRDAITLAYVNDATMTYTLKTPANTGVTDAIAIPMSYVAASNGVYRGAMDSAVTGSLSAGSEYWLEITVSGSVFRRIACTAQYRGTD